jgi:hypothetical protein
VLDLETRVKMVEERMADRTTLFTDIRQGLRQFEARVDARFAAAESRFTSIDTRFTGIEARLTELGQKIDGGLATVHQRIDVQSREVVALTGFVAIVAAVLAA